MHVSARDDEISRLGATMNQMLDRLNEANERQRQFVGDAAHELRTPLTRIRTNLDVDLAQPELADPMATIEMVRNESIELQQLVDDLLHLAGSDADTASAHREPVDLDDVVMEEIRQVRASHPNISVDASSVSAAHLSASPSQLRRAVRNVLANAVRHTHSAIAVSLRETGDVVELSIRDDGNGVPEAHQEAIFERFARVNDSRSRNNGGTGLGLAITRDIVERHGGTIHYDRSFTDGARFVVRLPNTALVDD